MEILEVVTDDFIVNCYRTIEQYLLSTRSSNLPLDQLPMIYENICKHKFPIPLSIIARGLLDHLFLVNTPATGVVFVEVARIQNTSREGVLAVHHDRISRLRDAMVPKPPQIADTRIAMSVQLSLRGLHRALVLHPVPVGLRRPDFDIYLRNIFFHQWNMPLLLDGTGFVSALALVEAFPRVFAFDKVSGVPQPLAQPDFTVGNFEFKGATTVEAQKKPSTPPLRIMSPEQAQLFDSIKGAMALLKVELMECGRDREKYNILSGKLSVKQKQLEELMHSFNSQISV